MKFKTLLITFNIVIILSFLIIFFLPFFILDGRYMQAFWSKNWFFGCIFFLVVLSINILFFLNWKTLSLLEKEDWPALSQYLENEVFLKKKVSPRNIRLLTDSLLLLGDFSTIRKVEETVRKNKSSLHEKYRLRFVISAMLSGDYEYMNRLSTLKDHLPSSSSSLQSKAISTYSLYEKEWLLFFSGLSCQLDKKSERAAVSYMQLLQESKNPVVLVLSAFFAHSVLAKTLPFQRECLVKLSLESRQLLLERYTRKKWDIVVSREKEEMHVLVLGKMLADATKWLFE